jgi:hypothetical protein
MLKKLKSTLFYRAFREKITKSPQIPVISIKGGSVSVLFNGTREDDRKTVHRLKKKLIAAGASSFKSLAYIDNKLPLENVDYAAYNKRNVNWYGVPSGEEVDAFIQLPANILIVLCPEMLPHFEYIIAHAQARFIIGPDISRSTTYFNLTVQYPRTENLQDMINALIKAVDVVAEKP